MSIDDIRAWGDANGFDVTGEGLPRGLRAAFNKRNDSTPAEMDSDTEERPPVINKAGPIERARSVADRVRKAAPPKVGGRGTRSKISKPRISVEGFISAMWEGAGRLLQPVNLPVANVLSMQAPVAGMILEDVVRDTVVDRFMQPLARGMNGGEIAIALVGPPLIVGALTQRPDKAALLIPMLRQSLRSWVRIAGPKLEKIAAENDMFEKEYGHKIDEMMERILSPFVDSDGNPVFRFTDPETRV